VVVFFKKKRRDISTELIQKVSKKVLAGTRVIVVGMNYFFI